MEQFDVVWILHLSQVVLIKILVICSLLEHALLLVFQSQSEAVSNLTRSRVLVNVVLRAFEHVVLCAEHHGIHVPAQRVALPLLLGDAVLHLVVNHNGLGHLLDVEVLVAQQDALLDGLVKGLPVPWLRAGLLGGR